MAMVRYEVLGQDKDVRKVEPEISQTQRKKRKRMSESPAILAARLKARRQEPLVVLSDVVGDPTLVKLSAEDLAHLRVDESYQRARLTHECHTLVHILRSGGKIPDPISVAERRNGARYVVDGQQRWWASLECAEPIYANIYAVHDIEAERTLFTVLNRRVGLTANTVVNASNGALASVIRKWSATKGSPYFGNVNLGRHNSKVAYAAANIARGAVAVMTGIWHSGSMHALLARGDYAYAHDPLSIGRLEGFLRLLPLVCPPTVPLRSIVSVALGHTAYEHWEKGIEGKFPTEQVWNKLKRINWESLTQGSHALRYLPIVEHEIRQRWPH